MTARTPRVAARCAFVAIMVTTTALGLAGCLSPSLSESQPQHPGRSVAWLIRRSLNMGFSLSGRTVEQVAPAGRYLVDVLEVPEQGEAIAQIGPTLTVRDLATGRPLWTLSRPVSQLPALTRNALYIGNSGYELASGRRFPIPVRVPAGSAPDPAGDGLLVLAGSPRGSALVALEPGTGAVRWRAEARKGSRYCGAINADLAGIVILRCAPDRARAGSGVSIMELDCFDPVTGKLRWERRLPAAVSPASMTLAMRGRTVLAAAQPEASWSFVLDAVTGSALPGLARAVWTRDFANPVPLKQGVFGAAYGFTSRAFYVLNGSELTAYALRTGDQAGRLSLPRGLPFGFSRSGLDGQLIPGPVPLRPGLNAAPPHDAVLAAGLLIIPTARGSLAAIRISQLAS
jgi:hypothetical protein